MTITREQLDEWARLCEAATKGPWTMRTFRPTSIGPAFVDAENTRDVAICGYAVALTIHGFFGIVDSDEREANAQLIASARTAVPALIAALAEAERDRDQARNISDDWKSAAETGVTRISALTSAMEKARGVMGILKPTSLLAAALLADALAAINEAAVTK